MAEPSRTRRIWKTAPHDEAVARELADALALPVPAARLMSGRGHLSAASVDFFLRPRLSGVGDPFRLPQMEEAIERIWKAIDAGEKIVVYGDYDVDGITSTALLLDVLDALGAKSAPFLPHRVEEGYGLSLDGLARCVDDHHPELIVTVDCGTGSVAAVEKARELGIDVVITDHHAPGHDVAKARAVVNPKLGTHESDLLLAGVGVSFKLAYALVKRGREAGRSQAAIDLRRYLDLVALGTVADIVPLQEENRIFVRHGLQALATTEKLGLRALIRVAGVGAVVDAHDIGFKLGPRLNAAGRLGDALFALELLRTRDATRADELALHLDQENRARQTVEAAMVEEAMKELEGSFDPARDFGLVCARDGWHPGVVGIVSSRITQRFGRPSIVIALKDGAGRGSCRSIEDFDMVTALGRCGDLLMKYGGHAMAAGLEIQAAHLAEFRGRFNAVAGLALTGRDLRPVQRVDVWIDALAEADMELLSFLDEARPFGLGNTTPIWACRNVRLASEPRPVGDGKHLKLQLKSGGVTRDAIWFGGGDVKLPAGDLDVAFQLKRNEYMGRVRIDLQIQDIRPTERVSG